MRKIHIVVSVLSVFLIPSFALAYGGPGSLLSGIGSFLAVIAAVFAALFGFIWYPIKRLLFGTESEKESEEGTEEQ